jgi:hypothetical protein
MVMFTTSDPVFWGLMNQAGIAASVCEQKKNISAPTTLNTYPTFCHNSYAINRNGNNSNSPTNTSRTGLGHFGSYKVPF